MALSNWLQCVKSRQSQICFVIVFCTFKLMWSCPRDKTERSENCCRSEFSDGHAWHDLRHSGHCYSSDRYLDYGKRSLAIVAMNAELSPFKIGEHDSESASTIDHDITICGFVFGVIFIEKWLPKSLVKQPRTYSPTKWDVVADWNTRDRLRWDTGNAKCYLSFSHAFMYWYLSGDMLYMHCFHLYRWSDNTQVQRIV